MRDRLFFYAYPENGDIMANTLTKAVVYNTLLDEVITAGLTSQKLTAGASRIKYNGGNTVKIAKLSVGGYGNYDRATGYPAGAATQSWEDHVITMDRGITFNVDVMDEDETMQTLSVANIITEFARSQAVPEIDSYRYSKIFQSIVDDATVRYSYYTPAEATILGTIQGQIADIQNAIGEQTPMTCYISGAAFKYLTQSTQLAKQLGVQNVTGANGITTKIYDIDGVPLVVVPSARMKTEYAFSATNGFAAKNFAQDINWILIADSAAVAFVKHQKTKIVSADDNQTADAEKVMAREYHDCWVYENKHNAIYVSLKTATIAGFGSGIIASSGATNASYTLGALFTNKDTGHEFYYLDGGSATELAAVACYDEITLTGWEKIEAATKVDDVTTSKYYNYLIEVDENGRVIRRGVIKTA
jgi:hypothetical protein